LRTTSPDELAAGLVELCLDDPEPLIRLQAEKTTQILGPSARVEDAGRWWVATLPGLRTIDERDTDSAVALRGAIRQDRAAAKLGTNSSTCPSSPQI
jgi:hypothetical protein